MTFRVDLDAGSQQPPSVGSTPYDLIAGMAASPREGFINSLAAPAGAIRRWLSLEEGRPAAKRLKTERTIMAANASAPVRSESMCQGLTADKGGDAATS